MVQKRNLLVHLHLHGIHIKVNSFNIIFLTIIFFCLKKITLKNNLWNKINQIQIFNSPSPKPQDSTSFISILYYVFHIHDYHIHRWQTKKFVITPIFFNWVEIGKPNFIFR